ncbi:hypothetical protein GEV33_008364 [Tenebrio molitor]|uniref:Uncharacterized protein n=1 Tax=Tenebrio molitor TaxID=7067 RepID=A0A8J6HHQ0_TENMO|nr:hypothetical protein GEV33_008364 [Tenebrio molitor]
MTFPSPRKPENWSFLREEPRKVEEDFSFKFHQPERTRFPVSRLNLDHRRRKERAADKQARRRRKPRRPTPPHREEEPSEGATLRDPPFPKKAVAVGELCSARSPGIVGRKKYGFRGGFGGRDRSRKDLGPPSPTNRFRTKPQSLYNRRRKLHENIPTPLPQRLSPKSYQYEDKECPSVEGTFFCDNKLTYSEKDCITSFMQNLKSNNCQPIPVSINTIIEPIKKNFVLIVPHKPIKIKKVCENPGYKIIEKPSVIRIPTLQNHVRRFNIRK